MIRSNLPVPNALGPKAMIAINRLAFLLLARLMFGLLRQGDRRDSFGWKAVPADDGGRRFNGGRRQRSQGWVWMTRSEAHLRPR